MIPNPACEDIRVELSARLDGEVDPATSQMLDEHLAGCAECRRYEAGLAKVRAATRLQVVEQVPDLTGAIMERVGADGPASRRRDEWFSRFRVAAVAAAASIVLLIGSSLPFTTPPDTASANEIVQEVRGAARSLSAYAATFDIIERGWHPDVPERRFTAELSFEAPESLELRIGDNTAYPDPRGWPRNDIELVANERSHWVKEPSSCPVAALPACVAAPQVEQRRLVQRAPFDGSTMLPTDVMVPLETIASADGLEVVGVEDVSGRSAYRVTLPYRQAVPLVAALQPGGLWRPFHPLDRVDVWIDADTWFPMRYRVVATDSADRRLWAGRLGLADAPGDVLYTVRATTFQRLDAISAGTFRVPHRGITRRGGFVERQFLDMSKGFSPRYTAGLKPYRAGTTGTGTVLAWADGMTWLKVVRDTTGTLAGVAAAEEIALDDGGTGYYLPASNTFGRRIDLYVGHRHIHVESNLPRAEVARVAAELPGRGQGIAAKLGSRDGLTVRRIEPQRAYDLGYAHKPTFLPKGYAARAAVLTVGRDGSRSVTVYYRRAEAEFDGLGIRVTQTEDEQFLPPSSSEYEVVALDGLGARWSPERGELEWIEGSVYRSVTAPSFEIGIALRVAQGLL